LKSNICFLCKLGGAGVNEFSPHPSDACSPFQLRPHGVGHDKRQVGSAHTWLCDTRAPRGRTAGPPLRDAKWRSTGHFAKQQLGGRLRRSEGYAAG